MYQKFQETLLSLIFYLLILICSYSRQIPIFSLYRNYMRGNRIQYFISPCWKYFFRIFSTRSDTNTRSLSSTITAPIKKWVVHPGLSKSYPKAPNSSIKAYFLLLILKLFIHNLFSCFNFPIGKENHIFYNFFLYSRNQCCHTIIIGQSVLKW